VKFVVVKATTIHSNCALIAIGLLVKNVGKLKVFKKITSILYAGTD
jgi:hypothetical protein